MIFYILTWAISIALSVVGSLTFWKVDQWYEFYIPIVLFIGAWAAIICSLWIFEDLSGRFTSDYNKTYEKPSRFNRFMFNQGLGFIRRLVLIFVRAKGKHKIPKNQPFLLVCNHRSYFDNFIITEQFLNNKFVGFLTKPDNYKLPLAPRHMHRLGYLKIDKNDKLQSLEVIKTCIDRIEKGYNSFAIFPEGTRGSGSELGEFHEGIFNIAIHAKCPIVVCAISGTEKFHKRWPLPTLVKTHVVGVLQYEDFEGQTAKMVSDNVKSIIEDDLKTME